MDRRLITPFDESPHISDLESLELKYEGLELSEIIEPIVTPREDIAGGKKTAKKSKRNRTRTKSGGGTLEKNSPFAPSGCLLYVNDIVTMLEIPIAWSPEPTCFIIGQSTPRGKISRCFNTSNCTTHCKK